MELENKKVNSRIEMMKYVKRDKKTDEIIGLKDNAPKYARAEYKKYLAERKRGI